MLVSFFTVLFSTYFPILFASAQLDIPIVSTRNFFNPNTGEMIKNNILPFALTLLNTNHCPGKIGIFIHGWWAADANATEQTERVFLSLQRSGYTIPIIGLSCPSHTDWNTSKNIANKNGPLLAEFIIV
jgi:hypothetical protein